MERFFRSRRRTAGRRETSPSENVVKQTTPQEWLDVLMCNTLLLGAGDAGKSVLFKQFIHVFGTDFSETERKKFIPIIWRNTLTSMRCLCSESREYGSVDPANTTAKKAIDDLQDDDAVTEQNGVFIKALWADPVIQTTYENRAKFQLEESAKYFFEKIDEISKTDYIPTYQDLLRSRVPTTGIVENGFHVDGSGIKVYDLGGQRSERKKWIHCFENATAVVFIAAISEYDQVLYEDENANRIVEALELWEEICNSEWFTNSAMILLLNKQDLFHEKLKKVPLQGYFPEYTGKTTQEAEDFMLHQFLSKNTSHPHVDTFFTCAVDEERIIALFTDITNVVIKQGLHNLMSGLIPGV